jgi:hypothetical protein
MNILRLGFGEWHEPQSGTGVVGELAEESLPESVSHRGGGAVAVCQMTVPVMELGRGRTVRTSGR